MVPIKAFASAKSRLADAVGPGQRIALARRLAEGVLAAAGGATVVVVCEDPEVADWARERGARTIVLPSCGLNLAIQHASNRLLAEGFDRLVVAHSDLVHPDALPEAFGMGDEIVLVPDRRQQGTNVLSLPGRDRRASAFRFGYGPGSFARHLRRARRIGLPVTVLPSHDLADDLDEPDGLSILPRPLALELGLADELGLAGELEPAHRFG
jgi:2-phospho-L-lactate guanylyltransferase